MLKLSTDSGLHDCLFDSVIKSMLRRMEALVKAGNCILIDKYSVVDLSMYLLIL